MGETHGVPGVLLRPLDTAGVRGADLQVAGGQFETRPQPSRMHVRQP
jgi:hypothetical protein